MGLYKCSAEDCSYVWSQDTIPDRCIRCGLEEIEEVTDGILDKELDSIPVHGDDGQLINDGPTYRVGKTKKSKGGKKVTRDKWIGQVEEIVDSTTVLDPELDFMNILQDMGLKSAKKTITETFFSGDIDKPEWLDEVLKMANINVSKRRLIIARYYGMSKDDVDKTVTDDDNRKKDKKNGKNEKDDEEVTSKDVLKILKKHKLESLEDLLIKKEIDEIKKEMEKGENKDPKTGEEKVYVYVSDGVPMKVSAEELIALKAAESKNQDIKKPTDTFAFELLKMEKANVEQLRQEIKEISKPDKSQEMYLKEMLNMQREELNKSREMETKLLNAVYGNQVDMLKSKLNEMQMSYQSKDDFLTSLEKDRERLTRLGLVNIDKDKEEVIAKRDMTNRAMDTVDKAVSEMSALAKVLLEAFKEDRKIQAGVQQPKRTQLTPEEQAAFYAAMQSRMQQPVVQTQVNSIKQVDEDNNNDKNTDKKKRIQIEESE